jgi:hypothetical protein
MQVKIDLTPEQALEGIAEALRELDRINDFLVEQGFEFPLGARGVKDMHSQLAVRLEEAQTELGRLREGTENQADRINGLEIAILAGVKAIEDGGLTDGRADALKIVAARIEEAREKATQNG